jgi:hypothetical protein
MTIRELHTPVAFIVFNRPETTKQVFDEIAKARPPTLLVVADGPRHDHPDEDERCAAVRKIIEGVDWDCDVRINYADTNMGCKRRVASGLDWVFSQVDEAIILEDDCVPDPSFFFFCEELLARYRDDQRVMMIVGTNYMGDRTGYPYSYFFSRYFPIWGWATWKRAWQGYDVEIKAWRRDVGPTQLADLVPNRIALRYIEYGLDMTQRDALDTWDFQWIFRCVFEHGLAIVPKSNLVTNIGTVGAHASGRSRTQFQATFPVSNELRHPGFVFPDREYDHFIFGKIIRKHNQLAGVIVRLLENRKWIYVPTRWVYRFVREIRTFFQANR